MKTTTIKCLITCLFMLCATRIVAQDLIYMENIYHEYLDDQTSRRFWWDITGDGIDEIYVDISFDFRETRRYQVGISLKDFWTRLDRMSGQDLEYDPIGCGTLISDSVLYEVNPPTGGIIYCQTAGMSYAYPGPDKTAKLYEAFRREIDGEYYYGWYYMVGVFVGETLDFSIKQAVFCNIPNYPLRVCQTSLYEDIEENEDMLVALHPNPTNSLVTVTGEDLSTIEVVNIMGQTVLKSDCSNDNLTIDLSGQPAGVYFFNIVDRKSNRCTKKVVKN